MRISRHIPFYLLFFIFTLILYSRLIKNLNNSLPSEGIRYLLLFNAQRGAENILNLKSPFYFEEVYYPKGSGAYEAMFPHLLLSLLGIIFNPFLAQNILIIFSFILSAISMYHLILYLTGERIGAFIAGMYFSFSPIHIMHVDIPSAFSIEWIPFFLLFFFKSIEFSSSWLYPFLSAVFFTLTSLSSWYYCLPLIVFVGIYLMFRIKFITAFIKPILKIFLFSFFFLIFPVLSLLHLYSAGGGWDMDVVIRSSPDFLSFFIPSANHLFFAKYFLEIYKSFKAFLSLNSNYITYSALFMAIFGFLKKKNTLTLFFLINALIFFLLSLGPVLQIKGGVISIGKYIIKLPSYPLAKHLKLARAFSRNFVMCIISFAILFSFGIKWIRERYKKGGVFISLFSITLIFEILPSPFRRFSPPPVPEFYKTLDREEGDFSILELPFDPYNRLVLYYGMYHHKKIIGGSGDHSFIPFWYEITKYPFLHQLITLHYKYEEKTRFIYEDIIEYDFKGTSAGIASFFDIKYAIIHKTGNIGDLKKFLEEAGWMPYHEDEYIYVYTPPKVEPVPFIVIGKEWSNIQLYEGEPIRWIKKSGTLEIISPDERIVSLCFLMKSLRLSSIKFFINDKELGKEKVPIVPKEFIFSLPLKKGKNTFRFEGEEDSYGIMKLKFLNEGKLTGSSFP